MASQLSQEGDGNDARRCHRAISSHLFDSALRSVHHNQAASAKIVVVETFCVQP
jgi:hypothetical protein